MSQLCGHNSRCAAAPCMTGLGGADSSELSSTVEQQTIGPVATRGAPPAQSFAAIDARAPIVFSLSGFYLLDQHIAARVAEFHDHVVVQHNGCALVGVSEIFHAHCDELSFGT